MENITSENGEEEKKVTQFLGFTVDNEDYGVNILRVQEIRGWEEVREIPNTPDYIKGVLNMRNTVVPIIDLRIRLGQKDVEYNATTVIIVLSVEHEKNSHMVGIVVDSVSDVLDIKENNIKPAPNFGTKINIEYISGMFMLGERMIVLVDADKLLNPEEMSVLEIIAS